MQTARRPTAGFACLLGLLLVACTPEPPTAPTPSQPPATTTPPAPPPQPPPVPIAGKYELAVRLGSACAASPVGEFFPSPPQKSRIRLYAATISGANTASVRLDDVEVREDPVWGYGKEFGIVLDQNAVSLSTAGGWVPDIMEVVSPEAWLFMFIWSGTGEVRGDHIEVRWQGRVQLVQPEENWSTMLWKTLALCDANDHELLFQRVALD